MALENDYFLLYHGVQFSTDNTFEIYRNSVYILKCFLFMHLF